VHRLTIEYATPEDPAAFDKRYDEEHVSLVHRLPGLTRFTLSRPRSLRGEAPYLVAELWFDDADALKAAMRSPEMGETAAHAQGFGVASTTFTGEVVEA
jgi:uncharacterized protein (TIGR02118 family)